MAVSLTPVSASEPGALDGFRFSCDRGTCGRYAYVGGSSLEVLARQEAAAHDAWHDARGDQ